MNQIDNFLDCFLKIIKKFLIRILSFDILLKHVMCAMIFGPLVKWDNTSFASLDQEFDSPRVHQLYGSVAQSGQSNRLIPGVSRVQIPPLLPTKLKKLIKKVLYGLLAQWLELSAHNRSVTGSSPVESTNGEIPKWLKGSVLKTDRGCKPREGSNPSFSANINFIYRGVEQSGSSSGS